MNIFVVAIFCGIFFLPAHERVNNLDLSDYPAEDRWGMQMTSCASEKNGSCEISFPICFPHTGFFRFLYRVVSRDFRHMAVSLKIIFRGLILVNFIFVCFVWLLPSGFLGKRKFAVPPFLFFLQRDPSGLAGWMAFFLPDPILRLNPPSFSLIFPLFASRSSCFFWSFPFFFISPFRPTCPRVPFQLFSCHARSHWSIRASCAVSNIDHDDSRTAKCENDSRERGKVRIPGNLSFIQYPVRSLSSLRVGSVNDLVAKAVALAFDFHQYIIFLILPSSNGKHKLYSKNPSLICKRRLFFEVQPHLRFSPVQKKAKKNDSMFPVLWFFFFFFFTQSSRSFVLTIFCRKNTTSQDAKFFFIFSNFTKDIRIFFISCQIL